MEVIKMSKRTDLAVECVDSDAHRLPKGIKRRIRKSSVCTITEIIVADEYAGLKLGKSKGRYITVQPDRLSAHPADFEEQAENIADEIASLLDDTDNVLVAGLGNRNITPDALGPLTASQVIATRHIKDMPGLPDMSEVTVITPGVTG